MNEQNNESQPQREYPESTTDLKVMEAAIKDNYLAVQHLKDGSVAFRVKDPVFVVSSEHMKALFTQWLVRQIHRSDVPGGAMAKVKLMLGVLDMLDFKPQQPPTSKPFDPSRN